MLPSSVRNDLSILLTMHQNGFYVTVKYLLVPVFLFLMMDTPSARANDRPTSSADIEKLLETGEELLSKNGNDRLHEIDALIAENLYLADTQNRIRYYLFKGGFSQKLMDFETSKRHYESALILTEKDDYRNLAIGHFGVSMFYKHFKEFELQEANLLKAYRFAKKANDDFWTLHAALGLAALSDSRGAYEQTREYLSKCLAIDSLNGAVRLRRANLYFGNNRFRLGMEDLWEVVLSDPKFENQLTMYALFNVISVHINMGSYEKAREILTIVLENPKKYNAKVVAYYTFYEGVLLQEEGCPDDARVQFIRALETFSDSSIQENVMRCLFPIDRDNWNPRYLSAMIDRELISREFLVSDLGKMIQLVLDSDKGSVAERRLLLDDSFTFMDESPGLSESYRLWLLELLQETNGNLNYRSLEMATAIDSLQRIAKEKKQTLVDNYVYVNNKVFNKRISENNALLHEKEGIIVQEKKTNSIFFKIVWGMIIVLLLISLLLYKIFNDRNKIRKLNEAILAKNLSLQQYGKEYENLLMILGHQVKKPVNQMHYGLSQIIDRTKALDDRQLDFILHNVSRDTEELSNRIKIILSLIKSNIENIAISTTRINIYDLIKERLNFFESHFEASNIQLNYKVDRSLYTQNNLESLSIIFDNLFENIRKYGVVGGSIDIEVTKTREGVQLEIRNSFSEQLQNLLVLEKSVKRTIPSFGLGHTIIQTLCDRLKIKYEFTRLNKEYATRLLFTS